MDERFLRVRLVPTDRTDLICIACFTFKTEYAVQPYDARVTSDPVVGCHKSCIETMHHPRKDHA